MATGRALTWCYYVDDGFCYYDRGNKAAEAELDELAKRFKIKIVDDPKQFLGLNTDAKSNGELKVSMRAYIDKMAADCLSKALDSWPKLKSPCKANLAEAYKEAKQVDASTVDPKLLSSYRRILGKAMFAASGGVRPDLAYPINVCARVATRPTPAMEQCLQHAIAFAGQTSNDGATFGPCVNPKLVGFSDSDWDVEHSTSAHAIMYGNVTESDTIKGKVTVEGKCPCTGYSSRRQHCIAMSSTEAEIIAASQAALELVYMRTLLKELGIDVSAPTVLYVDNSGAVELSKHRKSCNRSRHVQRRYLKIRELVAMGEIEVRWVETKSNVSDLMSKGTIDYAQYDQLRSALMGGAKIGDAPVKEVKISGVETVAIVPELTSLERAAMSKYARCTAASGKAAARLHGGSRAAAAAAMAEA